MHSVLAQLIGAYILEERKIRKITQRRLAKSVGCSEQFLGRIECGAVMIPDRILISCIEILSLKYEKLKKFYRVDSDTRLELIYKQVSKTKSKGQS